MKSTVPKRILILDDSELLLEAARSELSAAGFEVTIALDLLRLESAPGTFDLILLDVQMPEAFGDDVGVVLRHVKGLNAPIYLFSGLEEEDLALRAYEAGLDGFISKRAGIHELIERVRRILGATAEEGARRALRARFLPQFVERARKCIGNGRELLCSTDPDAAGFLEQELGTLAGEAAILELGAMAGMARTGERFAHSIRVGDGVFAHYACAEVLNLIEKQLKELSEKRE